MAPHVNAWIVARGINIGLNTRIYFSDEAAANAKRPGDQPDRVGVAAQDPDRSKRTDRRTDGGAAVYRFDIRLQGEDETVFFDV